MTKSELAKRFLSLLSWTSLAGIVDRAAFLGGVFFSAHLLAPEIFGRWGVAQSTVLASQVFVLFGGVVLIQRFVPEYRHNNTDAAAQAARFSILVSVVALAVFALLGIWQSEVIARQLFREPASMALIALLGGWVATSATSLLLQATLIALEDGRGVAIGSIASALITLLAIPIGAYFLGYRGMICGAIVAETVRTIIYFTRVDAAFEKIGENVFGSIDTTNGRKFISFALPVLLQAALYSPVLWLAQIIVLNSSEDGLRQMAIFGFGMLLFSAVLLVSTQVNRVAMPMMASLVGAGDFRRMRRFANYIMVGQFAFSVALGVPLLVGFMVAGPPTYSSEWVTLAILMLAAVVVSFQNTISNNLLVVGRPVVVLLTIVPWALLFIGLVYLSQPSGAFFLAVALLFAGVVRTSILTALWFKSAQPADLDHG